MDRLVPTLFLVNSGLNNKTQPFKVSDTTVGKEGFQVMWYGVAHKRRADFSDGVTVVASVAACVPLPGGGQSARSAVAFFFAWKSSGKLWNRL